MHCLADFYGIGDRSDITLHAVGFRMLLLATLAYNAVRAARMQQGPPSYRHARSTGRVVVAAHARQISGFWPHPRQGRDIGAVRR